MSNIAHGRPPLVDSSSCAAQSSLVDRLDPRTRLLVAVAFSVLVAVINRFEVLAFAFAAAVVGMALSHLRLEYVLRRLVPLNLVSLLLVALLPMTTPGAALISVGSVDYTLDGVLLAGRIALKANSIVLALLVLVASLDITTLGHALSHFRVPDKLTHLLLFTVRYLDVFRREYVRLTAAMKMRGFRPGMNRHTYRTYGYLVGMLLVRSLDRSERIVAAMKCRGFRGHFYLLDHFAFSRLDAWFALASLLLLVGLASVEWLWPIG